MTTQHDRAALEAAYRQTTYQLFLPEGAMALRVGEANARFAAWMKANQATCFAILTAWNPGSSLLSQEENQARQSRLECSLLEEGFEPFGGENVADAGDWPVEETCLVLDMNRDEALEMACEYGQAAFLWGESDGLGQLVWTGEGDPGGKTL